MRKVIVTGTGYDPAGGRVKDPTLEPPITTALDVASEIIEIMETYDRQFAQQGFVDTPGGLEHMGDVWLLLDGWRARLKANGL